MNKIQNSDLLLDKAISIIDNGRKKVIEAIYNESTKSYFKLGELIIMQEQQGDNKAEYGKKTIENLSKKLTIKYGKGFSVSTLWDCRKFFLKLQSLTGEFNFKLSFTHYTYLIRLKDDEMKFYEQYAIEQNLTVRQLQKEVQNNTILRVSQTQKSLSIKPSKPKDIIKDPYILDFLGLDEITQGKEKLLESKLIEHLEKFLLELGRGFAFVKRQYKLILSEDIFYADLIFYNIPLKCYVVIELKTRKLKHQDLGQLQMYVNYFDREIKDTNDNKTIGILLCSEKNDNVIKFTLPEDNEHIFASRYKLYLPSLEELKNELEELENR
ncbi:MAG: PDDEXK nuclease domain-containing protein [Campylobacterota bacterium]|nr:PDDEXK nuclease domain-containing protein [Campylobacterota bacterium]